MMLAHSWQIRIEQGYNFDANPQIDSRKDSRKNAMAQIQVDSRKIPHKWIWGWIGVVILRCDFLVSQHVQQGTVSPTRYAVVYGTSTLKADHMQR